MKEFQKYFDMFSSMTGQAQQTDKDRAAATAAEKPEILCYAPTVFKLPIDYLEQNEMYDVCNLLHKIIKERFDHDLNYKNILI